MGKPPTGSSSADEYPHHELSLPVGTAMPRLLLPEPAGLQLWICPGAGRPGGCSTVTAWGRALSHGHGCRHRLRGGS